MQGPRGPVEEPRIYPCVKCGLMRSKSEGGTTFTVCDKCWDEGHAQPAAPAKGPTLPAILYDHVAVAEKLSDLGWVSRNDAQWEHLRDWLISLRAESAPAPDVDALREAHGKASQAYHHLTHDLRPDRGLKLLDEALATTEALLGPTAGGAT